MIFGIIPYRTSMGDLHWPCERYRVYIKGEERPIFFAKKNWNASMKVNDKVNLVVRKSLFSDRLNGLRVIKADLPYQ